MTPLHITAFTLSSALGHGREAHRSALHAERSGLRPAAFDLNQIECFVGEVERLNSPLPARLRTFDCRNHRLAWLALQQDGFLESVAQLRARHGAGRIGVFIGSTTAGIHSAELAFRERVASDAALPDWFDYRHTQALGSAAEMVAAALDLQGIALTVSTACSSSAKVFATASRALSAGLCDAAVVGGVDSLCLTTLHGFNALQLIGAEPCRPADAARRGISIGEAAAFALLTRPQDSDAAPAGRLLGYGESSDAHHMSAPHPEGRGAAAAMRAALRSAGLEVAAIDYINLHGTGTPANDAAEDRAVCAVFGSSTRCSSTKGWTGHTLGAAGAIEACLTLLCAADGYLPRSLNTRTLDPAFGAQVLLAAQRAPIRHALSNSFGFGGSNCTLLLGAA